MFINFTSQQAFTAFRFDFWSNFRWFHRSSRYLSRISTTARIKWYSQYTLSQHKQPQNQIANILCATWKINQIWNFNKTHWPQFPFRSERCFVCCIRSHHQIEINWMCTFYRSTLTTWLWLLSCSTLSKFNQLCRHKYWWTVTDQSGVIDRLFKSLVIGVILQNLIY